MEQGITWGDDDAKNHTRTSDSVDARRISSGTVEVRSGGRPLVRRIELASGTTVGLDTANHLTETLASIDRLYPHIFDPAGASGEALTHLKSAIQDLQHALDDYGDANLPAVSSRLSQVAASMKKTQTLSDFNDSFGAVTSFVRRATLVVSPEGITRPALNAMMSCLQLLNSNPMLNLDDASDMIDRLANEGWNGSHHAVESLISELLADPNMDHEQIQSVLFPSTI